MNEDSSKLVDGVTIVPNKSDDFIRTWLEVLKPIHKLTPTEMDFAAALLKKRYEISEKAEDPATIDKALFDEDTKEEIRREANISAAHMKVLMHKLRQCGIVIDKRIHPKFLPMWERGKPFRWMFIFQNED